MAKDITIITPSYNQGEYIEETIQSVLSQTEVIKEYLLIDGNSNDATPVVLEKYNSEIDTIVIEPDNGQSDAINKGLKMASGSIINWLNSDDYYEKGCLSKVITCFTAHEVNVLCCQSIIFDSKGTKNVSYGTQFFSGDLAKTIGSLTIDQPATFFRKDAWDNIGLFVRTDLHYVMDKDLWLRYLLIYGLEGVKVVQKSVVYFRLHEESKTVSHQEEFIRETGYLFYSMALSSGFKQEATLLKEIYSISGNHFINYEYKIDKSEIRGGIFYHLLWIGEILYSKGNKLLATKCFEAIDERMLDTTSAKKLAKIRFRNKYIPVRILNKLRKK